MSLSVGTRLGTYEIVAALGAGGMGEVYQARDRKLGRDVAIKVLPGEFARDAGRVARFDHEARMLAAVNDPAIAAIYGEEEDGQTRYIVMELVEGETLSQRLAVEPLTIGEALRVAARIAEALAAAHEKGVIHRDLKPANIKITREGKVKILDFGLAKGMGPRLTADRSESPTLGAAESIPGEIVGTPEFMSPEQARGKETDRRTDIWAFGCILYEMLSGRRAFTGESFSDVVAAILHFEPDWSRLPPATPEHVRDLLRRCLEKDPTRRLRDAGDAQLEIEAALAGISDDAAARRRRVRHRWRTLAVASASLGIVVGAYFAVRRDRAARPMSSQPRQLAVLPFRNLTGSTEGELLGVGLTETVSARLANVQGLEVVTPSAAVAAADTGVSPDRMARRLGANTLLSGTVQRQDQLFRITYRLMDASGAQITANAIDGPDLFALQDRIADSVVTDLRLKRGVQPVRTPSGLETTDQQERYLTAVGLLQRYDRRDGVEKALAILTRLAQEKPNSPLVQAALARACLAWFRFTKERSWADSAIAASELARNLDPHLPEVDVIVGQTLFLTGQPKDAALAFRRALATRPGDVQALIGLGRAKEALGDRAGSEAAYRRATELQPSFAVFDLLGGLYFDRGRYREAAEMFRRATLLAPDSYWAFSNLGGAETMRCNFPAALDAYRKALELDPKNAIAATNLGMTQLWSGRVTEAVSALENAVGEAPRDFMLWGNLGDAYQAQGSVSKAADAYARSIAFARAQLELNPKDVMALAYVATGLARTGQIGEATRVMKIAVGLEPTNPDMLSDAAIVAALAGRDAEAFEWLRKAVAAGYCGRIIAAQPEFARFRNRPEFLSLAVGAQNATGS